MRHRGKEIHAGETLQLHIEYQTVAEGKSHRLLGLPPEITLLSEAALGSFPNRALARAVRKQVADRSRWLQRYLLADDVAAVFDKEWRSSVPSSVPAAAVDDFLASLEPAAPRWRTLRIPVEIPLRRLLTSVRLTPTSPTSSVYEGRALTFDLDLTTSFAWLGEAEKQAFRVTYDLTANAEDWVVVGKKRGIYTADVSGAEEYADSSHHNEKRSKWCWFPCVMALWLFRRCRSNSSRTGRHRNTLCVRPMWPTQHRASRFFPPEPAWLRLFPSHRTGRSKHPRDRSRLRRRCIVANLPSAPHLQPHPIFVTTVSTATLVCAGHFDIETDPFVLSFHGLMHLAAAARGSHGYFPT